MTALSAPNRLDKYAERDILAIEVQDGKTIHVNSLVALCSVDHATSDARGRVKAYEAANFETVIGLALPNPANATDGRTVGTTTAPRPTAGISTGDMQTIKRYAVTGATSQADVGKLVYASDDNVLTLTKPATAFQPVGFVTKWWSSTLCDIRLFGMNGAYLLGLCGGGTATWNIGIMSAGAPAGNVLTGIVMPCHGKITEVYGSVVVDATDADVVQTVNLEIGGTNVTGGVVTWSFGDAVGTKLAGTAVTAANEFHAGDLLDVETVNTVAPTTADPGLLNIYATIQFLPGV